MKLTQLSYVAAVAERGSLRAAARHLGIAQPAFSRSIAELERELGAPLFERRARGMVATPLGQAFVRRATAILNDTGAVISANPFPASAYCERTPHMHEIRADDCDL